MHPFIADFPSRVFYSGKLKTAVRKEDRVAPNLGFISREEPIVFIDVDYPDHRTGSSIKNEKEADVIVEVIKQLTGLGKYKDTEIAILTPYVAQVKCLREKLALVSKVEVSSIDGFQGKEKEVIVFSTVRNNPQGTLGFTDSPYRINVLLTRAKCALIGVGNRDTLRNSTIWAEWTFRHPILTEKEFFEGETVSEDELLNQNNNNSRRNRSIRDMRSRAGRNGYGSPFRDRSYDRNLESEFEHSRQRPTISSFVSVGLRSRNMRKQQYRDDANTGWDNLPLRFCNYTDK